METLSHRNRLLSVAGLSQGRNLDFLGAVISRRYSGRDRSAYRALTRGVPG